MRSKHVGFETIGALNAHEQAPPVPTVMRTTLSLAADASQRTLRLSTHIKQLGANVIVRLYLLFDKLSVSISLLFLLSMTDGLTLGARGSAHCWPMDVRDTNGWHLFLQHERTAYHVRFDNAAALLVRERNRTKGEV